MLGRSYIFQTFVKSGARGSTASHPRCSEASCADKHYQTYLANQRSIVVLSYVTAATRAPEVRKPNSTVIVGRRDITSATAQAPFPYSPTRLIPNSFQFSILATCNAPEARDVIDKQHHEQLNLHTRHHGRQAWFPETPEEDRAVLGQLLRSMHTRRYHRVRAHAHHGHSS